jgi:hypothetical protein
MDINLLNFIDFISTWNKKIFFKIKYNNDEYLNTISYNRIQDIGAVILGKYVSKLLNLNSLNLNIE